MYDMKRSATVGDPHLRTQTPASLIEPLQLPKNVSQPEQCLTGIRVLDFTQVGPGPLATMMLGDLGATVLSVLPPSASTSATKGALQRNKYHIRLDLRSEKDASVAFDLAVKSDVVVEGMRPGLADELGLGFDRVAKVAERVVYCAISAHGRDGPCAEMAGFDLNAQAKAGILDLNRSENDAPRLAHPYAGEFGGGGLLATIGILAALSARARTGKGQLVDVAMAEGAMITAAAYFDALFTSGRRPRPPEFAELGHDPLYDVYSCEDTRWIAIAAQPRRFAAALMAIVSKNTGIDPDIEDSQATRRALVDMFSTRPRDEWCAVLQTAGIPATPVLRLEEVADDPHLAAREMVITTADGIQQVGVAPKFSATPSTIRKNGLTTEEELTAILIDWSGGSEILTRMARER